MDDRQQIELAAMAANLGRSAMYLETTKDVKRARMILAGIVAKVRELDGFLDLIGGSDGPT